jgi:transcriptional regulator with XRE-family HTH domain
MQKLVADTLDIVADTRYICCMDATPRSLAALLRTHNKSAIARELGVTTSTVTRWVNGETVPSGDKLIALARLLGIDAASIELSSKAVA